MVMNSRLQLLMLLLVMRMMMLLLLMMVELQFGGSDSTAVSDEMMGG